MTAENHSPPARSLRRTQCTNLWVVYNCALSKLSPWSVSPAFPLVFFFVPLCVKIKYRLVLPIDWSRCRRRVWMLFLFLWGGGGGPVFGVVPISLRFFVVFQRVRAHSTVVKIVVNEVVLTLSEMPVDTVFSRDNQVSA